MKTKKKSLKITTSFPPRMSELIETYAKNHKITLEQAVGDLVFNGLMSMSFWNTTKKILDKIFPKKTG